MARRTERDHYSAAPRPIRQSLWLLATVVMTAVILSAMGESLSVASAAGSSYTGQDLLDLARPTDTSVPAGKTPPGVTVMTSIPITGNPVSGNPATDVDQPASPTMSTVETTRSTVIVRLDSRARGEAALATISYPWPELLPDWAVTFHSEEEGLYGLTLVSEQRIEIYVRPDQSTDLLAHVIAHELGHAVDVSLNSGPDRRRWEASRGLGSQPWWPSSGTTDFSTGAGDFAESFAAWQVGTQSFRSRLAGPPTAEQITLLAELSAG